MKKFYTYLIGLLFTGLSSCFALITPDEEVVLGLCYLYGGAVAQNDVRSFSFFLEAAKNGDASGQNNLGVSYATGRGVKKQDYSEAVSWFQKSAEQGWSEAQFNLGICYAKGFGVEKNLETAKQWFAKAARRGIHHVFSKEVADLGSLITEDTDSFDKDEWVRNWGTTLGYGFFAKS